MMTAEEALHVWCPQTERKADDTKVCTCIGPQCALWEWLDPPAMGASRRGECGMKRKSVVVLQQSAPGPKIPVLGKA